MSPFRAFFATCKSQNVLLECALHFTQTVLRRLPSVGVTAGSEGFLLGLGFFFFKF